MEQQANAIAEEFFDCMNDLNTYDLQENIAAAVSKLGLSQWEAWEVEGLVFDRVYENHTIQQ